MVLATVAAYRLTAAPPASNGLAPEALFVRIALMIGHEGTLPSGQHSITQCKMQFTGRLPYEPGAWARARFCTCNRASHGADLAPRPTAARRRSRPAVRRPARPAAHRPHFAFASPLPNRIQTYNNPVNSTENGWQCHQGIATALGRGRSQYLDDVVVELCPRLIATIYGLSRTCAHQCVGPKQASGLAPGGVSAG
jgi:hypothetical protein